MSDKVCIREQADSGSGGGEFELPGIGMEAKRKSSHVVKVVCRTFLPTPSNVCTLVKEANTTQAPKVSVGFSSEGNSSPGYAAFPETSHQSNMGHNKIIWMFEQFLVL